MKLLYDLVVTQPNTSGKMHGAGKYAIMLFFELLKIEPNIECIWDSTKYLDSDVKEKCLVCNVVMYDISKIEIQKLLNDGNFDRFYSALPAMWSDLAFTKVNFIGTIHGLREIEMPVDLYFYRYRVSFREKIRIFLRTIATSWWRNRAKKKIEKLMSIPNFKYVAVSQHTKYSILSHFPNVCEHSIQVFYSPSTSKEAQIKPYSSEKYILLVSGNRPEKNVLRSIKALDELFTERNQLKGFRVYVTGATGKSLKYSIKNHNSFEFLGYVDEEILDSLYQGAFLFLYPSVNEGFGYPPIEAMHYGVPILASPFSSIYEVCYDAALYFNAFDYIEQKARILQIICDKDLYNKQKRKSLERYLYITRLQNDNLHKMVRYILSDS